MLTITNLAANIARDTDFLGKMDPYCIVYVGAQQQRTQVLQDRGRNPRWNDTLVFNAPPHEQIRVRIYDHDTGVDDFIGEAVIPVSQAAQQRVVNVPFYSNNNSGTVSFMAQYGGSG